MKHLSSSVFEPSRRREGIPAMDGYIHPNISYVKAMNKMAAEAILLLSFWTSSKNCIVQNYQWALVFGSPTKRSRPVRLGLTSQSNLLHTKGFPFTLWHFDRATGDTHK